MKECKYKRFFERSDGNCQHSFPECRNTFGVCWYEEKYQDLLMDARIVARELAEERGDYEYE